MKKITFEAALDRVQQINDILASGEASLDESLELFKEATELITFCNTRINEAKLVVEECKDKLKEE